MRVLKCEDLDHQKLLLRYFDGKVLSLVTVVQGQERHHRGEISGPIYPR